MVLAAGAFGVGDALASGGHSAAAHAPAKGALSSASSSSSKAAPRSGRRWQGYPGNFTARGGAGLFGGLASGGAGVGGAAELGTVTSISSTSLTISLSSGGTESYTLAKSTNYFTMFTPASQSAVAKGDRVLVLAIQAVPVSGPVPPPGATWKARPTGSASPAASASTTAASSSSTPTASDVVVVEPFAWGTVVSASSKTIVVQDVSGLDRDILVGSGTTYTEDGVSIGAGTITKGEELFAYGAAASDPTELAATHVAVFGPSITGSVKSVSGSTITVETGRSSVAVETDSSTIFKSGTSASSLKDVKSGDFLSAIGLPDGTGKFAASAIQFSAPVATPQSGSHGFSWKASGANGFGSFRLGGFGSGIVQRIISALAGS